MLWNCWIFSVAKDSTQYTKHYNLCSRDKSFIDEQVLILTPDTTSSKTYNRWLGPTKNDDTFQPYVKREFGKKVSVYHRLQDKME